MMMNGGGLVGVFSFGVTNVVRIQLVGLRRAPARCRRRDDRIRCCALLGRNWLKDSQCRCVCVSVASLSLCTPSDFVCFQVIHGKAEDIELPSGLKVDVIVSEWMGFYLVT